MDTGPVFSNKNFNYIQEGKMRSIVILCGFFCCGLLCGQIQYPNLLKNSSFEQGTKFWKHVKLLPGQGPDKGTCAVYEQKDPKGRVYPFQQTIELESNCEYEYGAYVKTAGKIQYTNKPGLIFVVTFYDLQTGKYVTSRGYYTELNVPTWEMYCQTFKTPGKKYRCTFSFYLERGSTGKVFVDEVFVRKMKKSGMRDAGDPENVVENPKLDYGSLGYRGGAKSVVDRTGTKPNHVLLIDRIGKNFHAVRQDLKLEPNTKYVFGGRVKGLGKLASQKNIVRLTIEPRRAKDRQFHGIVYAQDKGQDPETSYNSYEGIIQTFPGQDSDFRNELTIYLTQGKTGTAYVDDLYVRKLTPGRKEPNGHVAMVYPAFSRIPPKGIQADFVLTHKLVGRGVISWSLLDKNGKKYTSGKVTASGTRFQISFGKLPEGEYKLRFVMPESWGSAPDLPVRVAETPAQGKGSLCTIDRRGRLRVNGKLYMPLGFYIYDIPGEHIAILAKSPFNTVMSYQTERLNLKGGPLPKGADVFKETRAVLDELHKNNIKIIYSVKEFYPRWSAIRGVIDKEVVWNSIRGTDNIIRAIVREFASHPALLGWYICDEIQQHLEEYVVDKRRLLNQLDGRHPTWAVHLKGQNYRFHILWQDMFGYDPYPIDNNETRDMKLVTDWASAAQDAFRSSKSPFSWGVLQLHHKGIYDRSKGMYKNYFKYRAPTEQEMLSFAINAAIHGAKGFIYFNFSDLFRGPEKDQFAKRWPGLLRIGKTMKSLERFIMSDKDSQNLKIRKISGKGKILSRVLYDDNNKPCILLAAEGPGKVIGEFVFKGEVKSVRGRTVALGNNRYRFTAENVDCDILH